MKVLIISDTHGKSSCLKQIHDIVGDVEMLIHLGDVEGDEKLIHDLFDCEIHGEGQLRLQPGAPDI